MKNKLFYKYYDSIFSAKNYKSEVDTICSIYKSVSGKSLEDLLEIGCGTGNHSIEFAERGIKVKAMDIDPNMISIAKKKEYYSTNKLEFVLGNISSYRSRKKINCAISVFNVINYISSVHELLNFFKGIYKNLNNDGIYIFDCINGIASIKDPPVEKNSRIILPDNEILLHINPINDTMNQHSIWDYSITIYEEGKPLKLKHKIDQYLWTPSTISGLLEISGFQILKMSRWMDIKHSASIDDWKIMFICRK